MNFDSENKNHSLMLVSFLLVIFSLFMPWSSDSRYYTSIKIGLVDYGILFILPWIGPAYSIFNNEPYNKGNALGLAVLHTILIFTKIFVNKICFKF